MPTTRIVLRESDGVRLDRIDRLRDDNLVTASRFELMTVQGEEPLVFADLRRANAAFTGAVNTASAPGGGRFPDEDVQQA